MMYGVYAGAGTSMMILSLVVFKTCYDLCCGNKKQGDWKDNPETVSNFFSIKIYYGVRKCLSYIDLILIIVMSIHCSEHYLFYFLRSFLLKRSRKLEERVQYTGRLNIHKKFKLPWPRSTAQ